MKRIYYYLVDHKSKQVLANHLTHKDAVRMVKDLTVQYKDNNRFRCYPEKE